MYTQRDWQKIRSTVKAVLSAFLFLGLNWVSIAHAEELSLRSEPINIQFLFGAEALSLAIPSSVLNGIGPSFGARFSTSQKWFLMASVSQIMDTSAGLTSALSSTIRASAYYSLGEPLQGYTTEIDSDGQPITRVNNRGDNGWAVGVSSSENFLTGNKTVLAAPGFAANLLYQDSFWGLTWVSEFRYGMYSVNNISVSGIGLSLSLLFF